MRLLRLDVGDEQDSLHLHPLLTLVSGVPDQAQLALADAIRRLAAGSTAGLRGLVQHRSLLMEIGRPLPGETASAATTVDPIVHLGGSGHRSDAVGLRGEIDQWERRAHVDAVALEEVRADLDPTARAGVAELERRWSASTDDQPSGPTETERRRRHLRSRLDRLRRADRLQPLDPEVEALARRWQRLVELQNEHAGRLTALEQRRAEAAAAVAEAEAAAVAAERAAAAGVLTADEESRLMELTRGSGGERRTWWRSRSGAEQDDAEREALLAKADAESWTQYTMRRLSAGDPVDTNDDVIATRERLRWVRQHLAKAELALDQDEVACEAATETAALTAAIGVVGTGGRLSDVEAWLDERTRPTVRPDWLDQYRALVDEVRSEGLDPIEGDPDAVLGWIAERLDRDLVDDQRSQTARELERARHRLDRHVRALRRIDRIEREALASSGRLDDLLQRFHQMADGDGPTLAAEVLDRVGEVVDRIGDETGGSVPVMLVAGDLAGLDDVQLDRMMQGLRRMAERVQIIIASSRPELRAWVDGAGMEQAGTASLTTVPVQFRL